MIRWLYAVALEGAAPEGIAGAGGGPLAHTEGRGLTLVYERCDSAPKASRERVLAFGSVLQRLCAARTALPFRFGATVASEPELHALLEQRAEEWRRRLDAVRGQSELIVHVEGKQVAAQKEAPVPRTGAGYLAGRAEALRRTRAIGETLCSQLAPRCTEVRLLPSPAGAIRVACLARAEDIGELEAGVREWTRAHPEDSARVTGPWPPFSFSEEVPR